MIVITGATGQLGRLVVERLLHEVPADQIVAAVRSPEKAADLGVAVREADYDRPETLASAFAGADKLLLISGSEVGKRVPQHTAAVEAAKQAGVRHLVYTSAPHADTTTLVLAPEHKATEQVIRDSGVPFTFLRNGWYTENYADRIKQAAQTGIVIGSAGEGRVASAPRADYAAAAVAVLTGQGHENKIYELSGDTAWTFPELAAEIAAATGRDVEYRNLTPEEHKSTLADAGLPEAIVELVDALDADTADGALSETSGELRTLIGRPTVPLADTVAEIVKH
jgi:NAD(P)H dehydrogenase (quinone)